jgi:decaprenyl-phosphate phosphoribosyltransferase
VTSNPHDRVAARPLTEDLSEGEVALEDHPAPQPPAPVSPTRGVAPLLRGLLRTARPRQWIKNVLVFAAPGAAGVLDEAGAIAQAMAAFAVFCLASSGTYYLNDALDVEHDRLHLVKKTRPVAAGVVPVTLAKLVGALLLASGVLAAFLLDGWRLALVIGIYVALQPIYSIWLKNVPVLDLAAVASGFVLRAIAGAVAVDVPVSKWFLIVTSFGSLFMVAGKRHAEHIDLGDERVSHRATLGEYSVSYLRYVRSVSSGVALAAYCLWAFEKSEAASAPLWFELSIVPFALAILRYALLLDTGKGGAPEEVVLQDRLIQVLGLVWVMTFAVGVHAA